MKKILIPSLLASILFASEQNYIEIGGGVIKSKDNFSTESTKNISGLGKAKNENIGFPYIEMFYGYDITDSTNLYIASGIDGVKLGSIIDSSSGTFDVGLKVDASEEWENPFLTGSNRNETDVVELGVYAGYSLSFHENHDGAIRYEFSAVEYDKETVSNDLKREGNRHILSFENIFNTKMFDKELNYVTNLSYEKYDADGKSSSYDKYELLIGAMTKLNENLFFSLFTNVAKQDYEQTNTQVNKKIDVDIYGVNAGLRWDKPFSYDNTYVNFKTGYEKEEANHNFYDKENTYGLVSVGYKF